MGSFGNTFGIVRTVARPRARVWPLVAALATAMSTVSLMLPWATTGATRRSAFALAGDLRHAGLLTGPLARVVAIGIVAVPFVALIALVVLLAPPRHLTGHVGGALATLTGALTAAAAGAVVVAGGRRALTAATVALVAGLLTVAAGLSATLTATLTATRSTHG